MEPVKNEQVSGRFDSLKQVTPLSKYLAMIIFIVTPFVGGWIGYMYAPEKVIEIEANSVVTSKAEDTADSTTETLTLCGKKFRLEGTSFIDGVNVAERVAELLSNEVAVDNRPEETACHWIIANSQDMSRLKVTTERVRYDFTPITTTNSFEAYLVKFEKVVNFKTEGHDILGEGNLIDKNTHEVFRINEMDGSKGASLGKLTE
jgi:hypothetical protein